MRSVSFLFLVFPMMIIVSSSAPPPVQADPMFMQKMEKLTDGLIFPNTGEVLGADGEMIYISLGERESVYMGAQFEVARPEEMVKIGDRVVQKEREIGLIEVVKVEEEISLAKPVMSIAVIEAGDRVYCLRKKIDLLAVLEFPCSDRFNNLSKNVYESLQTNLVRRGRQVVEQRELNGILEVHGISHSGLLDVPTAQQIGRLAGAQAVILGSITDMGNEMAVRARMLDVEKGIALTASEVAVKKTPSVIAMISRGARPGIGAGNANFAQTRPPRPTASGGYPYWDNGWLRIEAVSITPEKDILWLKLRLSNHSNSDIVGMSFSKNQTGTYLISDIYMFPIHSYSYDPWSRLGLNAHSRKIVLLGFIPQETGFSYSNLENISDFTFVSSIRGIGSGWDEQVPIQIENIAYR